MKKVSIILSLVAMMLFVYGCGEDSGTTSDSGSNGRGASAPSGDSDEAATQPDTNGDARPDTGGAETPDTGGGEERSHTDGDARPDTDGAETPDTGGATAPTMTIYEFEKGGVAITHPEGWNISEEEDTEDNVLIANIKPRDNSLGTIEMSISIMRTNEATLQQLVETVINQLKEEVPDLTPSQEEIKVGDRDAVKIAGEFTEDGAKRKGTAVMMVHNGHGYIILYANTPQDFDKAEDIFKTLYEKLDIKKNPQLPGAPTDEGDEGGGGDEEDGGEWDDDE